MRRLYTTLLVLAWIAGTLFAAETNSFRLKDGTYLAGETGKFTFNKDGVMVRYPGAGYSKRVSWDKFSQSTLRKLIDNRDAVMFIEPFLEAPPEAREKSSKARTIKIKPFENRLEQPKSPSKLVAPFVSPVGLILALLVYAGSIYAAYEIAILKNRPAALVCTTAAVLPVLGTVLFLALPAAHIKSQEELAAEAEAAALAEAGEAPPVESTEVLEQATVPVEVAPQSQLPQTVMYQRGQFVFNRRFFETKLAPFFKTVLADNEKDMLVTITSARGEFTGQKFTKALQNEATLLTQKGGASAEVTIPYAEINQIVVKHKDA